MRGVPGRHLPAPRRSHRAGGAGSRRARVAGACFAFCALAAACWHRQARVLEFWKYKTRGAFE
eukprot:7435512-Lingulodinium_polyedra.AAC.1